MFTIFSENIQVEDTEDSIDIKNQWPCKSFFVAAISIEEEAWIKHIKDFQSNLLLVVFSWVQSLLSPGYQMKQPWGAWAALRSSP